MTPRIRVSAILELKESSGKDQDEIVREADQAPDSEKCLVLGYLLTGPARNWYRQLSRSTRGNWKNLLEAFQTQYCGRGISVARKYYHAKKRSDESPIEYLHRLNVTGMLTSLQIKDGPAVTPREYFIKTLDERYLADQWTLLRRAKARQGKAHVGSNKFRQTSTPENQSVPAKNARSVPVIQKAEDSSESESDASGSEQEAECRRVYLAESKERGIQTPTLAHQDNRVDHTTMSQKNCTHWGSTKHDNLGCWKRLTCQKCGRKGHPSDH
ncbi:hypothetical protein PHMEG_00012252 [Phytophthora megakarya]|uniref:Retrotransposon gag domain-containing protein n=1 Tax=Phytophthora megakarya TaxID=4795 RepID=A0A225WBS7_9STRA|nr:hypothetical protein PHMEG_00012252 [Phytophthora megakarya]